MSEYKGQYPLDGELKDGTLFTFSVYQTLMRPWAASFYYDEREVPGEMSVLIVSERNHLDTELQALEAAKTRGFVLSTKEGE